MKLKIRIRSTQILSSLWQRFAPSALTCLLLTAVAITYFSVDTFASYEVFKAADKPFAYIFSALGMGLLLTTTASVLCERYDLKKFIAWIAAAVGAVVGILLLYLSEIGLAVTSTVGGIVLFCLALCLHAVSGKKNPSESLFLTVLSFAGAFWLSVLVFAFLSICGSAVFNLLIPNASSDIQAIFMASTGCICFLTLAPFVFLGSLPKQDMPPSSSLSRITCRIALPPYLLFLSILLLYVVKIALTLTMPVGVMNGYSIAALTLFTGIHLLMTDDQNRLVKWFKNWGGLLLVPIVVAQGIGVWMRVSAYGLTEARVLGMIWTALCIAVVITSLFRKRANWFFLAAGVIAVVLLCTPLTVQNIAIMNQESRLSAALERNNMMSESGKIVANANVSAADHEIIYSAIDYLEEVTPREGSLTAQLHSQTEELSTRFGYSRRSSSIKMQLLGFAEPQTEQGTLSYSYYTFYGTANRSKLDTKGYDYAELISVTQYAPAADSTIPTMESTDRFYGTTDISALLAPLKSDPSTALHNLTVPVTFMIDGEEVDLAPLLNSAYAENGKTMLATDTIILPSGKKLHFNEIRIAVYYSSSSLSDYIGFTAWLLTPEE